MGEDNNQEIAHIKHDDKWVVKSEINWIKKVRKGEDESDNEDNGLVLNSMYSLVRLFDKNKLKYFNEKFLKNDIYNKCRKLERENFDPNLITMLINNLITLAK
jgi:hypothetical protein